MEATINGTRKEISIVFAEGELTMHCTAKIDNGALDEASGMVNNASGQHVGNASINSLGQHVVATVNGGSPSAIAQLLEAAVAWIGENVIGGETDSEE